MSLDNSLANFRVHTLKDGASANAQMERDRIVCVFDEDYSSHGSMLYSMVHMLTDQIGEAFSYDVFCLGRYRGPKFTRAVRVGEARKDRFFSGLVGRGLRWLRRLPTRLGISESPHRWACNLNQGEKKLLRRLFNADTLHAVLVFTADAAIGLRIARLAHIYSTSQCPHLVVVTSSKTMDPRIAADLDWLGVGLLLDGDLIVDRSHPAPPHRVRHNAVEALPPVFSFLAPEEYPRPYTNPCDPVDWAAWIHRDIPYPRRVRDVVLFVRPDWANCGSGTTFEILARWFRQRDALIIDIGIWPFGEDFNPISSDLGVASEQDNIRSALYFAVRRSTSLFRMAFQCGLLFRWFPFTVARQKLFQYSLAAKPRFVQLAIKHAKISHIYVNHYFTYGYVRKLIAGRPFFLDTHDIQTVNFIQHNQHNFLTRRADRFAGSLRDEMEIAGIAERLCFVSQDELNLAAAYIDRDRLSYVLPLPNIVASTPRPRGTSGRLLIVSSENPANVRGLNWFFTNVWPIVQELREDRSLLALHICGGIYTAMAHVKLPGVTFIGIVPDLSAYYEEADLVLLPVVSGGGVAIKTLEAILHERPVLATRHALRGLPDNVIREIGYEDNPVAYAKSLLAIMADPLEHQARSDRSREGAKLLRSHSFQSTWGEAVDAICLTDTQRNSA